MNAHNPEQPSLFPELDPQPVDLDQVAARIAEASDTPERKQSILEAYERDAAREGLIFPEDVEPLGKIATEAAKPELPENVRQMIESHRNKPKTIEERFLDRQRARYSRPEDQWQDDL